MFCFCGSEMKVVRRDKQCLEDGTFVVLFFRCPSCHKFIVSDLLESEMDYE